VLLSITENEDIFLDSKKVSVEELTTAVRKLIADKGHPSLAMKADKKVSYGFLIQVLDALKEAGVKGNLSALTERK
jgi:biopolymer transport protein ExbD